MLLAFGEKKGPCCTNFKLERDLTCICTLSKSFKSFFLLPIVIVTKCNLELSISFTVTYPSKNFMLGLEEERMLHLHKELPLDVD